MPASSTCSSDSPSGGFANEIFWGLFLFVACFGYLNFSFTGLLMPQYVNTVARIANIAILGEAPIILWLVVMGARPGPLGTAALSPTAR